MSPGPLGPFGRVLVGVDGSAESDEAIRQAAALAEGELTLLAVYDTFPAVVAGPDALPRLDEDAQRRAAEEALARAGDVPGSGPLPGKAVCGDACEELCRECEREQVTLLAVGSHGAGRMRGIVLGSTATCVVHQAPCSVLVAREAGEGFPRSIVVGIDGSPESAAAYVAARRLSERHNAELLAVVAHGGKAVDERLADAIAPGHATVGDDPAAALVAAAADADLLVVGSRGLHGLRALGSVSERVAHEASCSVLILRKPVWQRVAEELER